MHLLIQKIHPISSILNEKINGAIQDALNQLKSGYTKSSSPGIKILKIDLNQNDIAQEQEQEDFEIPEELMKEINKNENIDINNNHNDKKINEKENPNINKQDL